jgi:hypothetical protein
MAFGCLRSNNQSETEEYSVDDAQLKDENGIIKDYATHSGEKTTTDETVIVGAEPVNTAINGQTGTNIVSSVSISRSNTDFAKVTTTSKEALT